MTTETTNLNEPMVTEALNTMYNLGIVHALSIVKDAYLAYDGEVMLKGKYTNEVFHGMIKELEKLIK